MENNSERQRRATRDFRCPSGALKVYHLATIPTLVLLFIGQSLPLPADAATNSSSVVALEKRPSVAAQRRRLKMPDETLLDEVAARLLGVVEKQSDRYSKVTTRYVWPPRIMLVNERVVNADAWLCYKVRGGVPVCPVDKRPACPDHEIVKTTGGDGNICLCPVDKKTHKFFPRVEVYQGLMDGVIEGNPDRLALLLGHELAHILLGHILDTSAKVTAPTTTLSIIFTADQEHDADILGMQLALAAGYSISGAREVWNRMMSDEFKQLNLGQDYTSFEGRAIDHPAWTDRLALIDKEKETLWKAMSAFENGVFFLTAQQYPTAEESFEVVTKDFPASYEAWANLGYARLMMYFDAFEENDIARYDVGQVAVGSFYFRPESMKAATKGVDEAMWRKAKEALEKALQLNPRLALAKANLGLIYLFHPRGKDAATAVQHLEEAVTLSPADKTASDVGRISVLNNSAVALLSAGQAEKANARLDQALNSRLSDVQESDKRMNAVVGEAIPALAYNVALLLSRSSAPDKKKQGAMIMANYLEKISPSSLWWKLAYIRYARLCNETGMACKTMEEMRDKAVANTLRRQVISVDLTGGKLITLAEPVERVRLKLGKTTEIPVAEGTTLTQMVYPQFGIDLLATRRVIAIFLRGAGAPALKLRGKGTASRVSLLKVGMTEVDVETALGTWYYIAPLTDPSVKYRFYPEVGIAVGFNGKTISELVITQIVIGRRS